MITITFGALAMSLAATASLSACLGLFIGCLIQVASERKGNQGLARDNKRRPDYILLRGKLQVPQQKQWDVFVGDRVPFGAGS